MAGGTERTALEDPQEPQLVSHLQARCPINFLIFFLNLQLEPVEGWVCIVSWTL